MTDRAEVSRRITQEAADLNVPGFSTPTWQATYGRPPMTDPIESILERAITARTAAGLTTEIDTPDGSFRRHFANHADLNAYVDRCHARGETPRVVLPERAA